MVGNSLLGPASLTQLIDERKIGEFDPMIGGTWQRMSMTNSAEFSEGVFVVFGRRTPFQIADAIIRWVSILMIALFAQFRWTVKDFKNHTMYQETFALAWCWETGYTLMVKPT